MDLNVPDFLGPPGKREKQLLNLPATALPTTFRPFSATSVPQFSPPQNNPSLSLPARKFAPESAREFVPARELAPHLAADGAPELAPRFAPEFLEFVPELAPAQWRDAAPDPRWGHFGARARDPFALPAELQGGVGTILSRRPLYAAESFTRTDAPHTPLLASIAAANRISARALDDQLLRLSLGGWAGFQARRPSQLADYLGEERSRVGADIDANIDPSMTDANVHPGTAKLGYAKNGLDYNSGADHNSGYVDGQDCTKNGNPNINYTSQNIDYNPANADYAPYNAASANGDIVLDNGLLLRNHYILASPELKAVYARARHYFQDGALCAQVQRRLARLVARPAVARLVAYVKNANNLAYAHKTLCLVVNKNGKLDLLSYPSHSNLQLQRDDLVIVDGDRGKDMVMIVDPAMRLDLAVLFNFVKKTEHLKSLTIVDAASATGRLHAALVPAGRILNSGEDNEFTILLPTKQVLRFATPKEVHRLSARFAEERRAFVTCHSKIKELGLDRVLTLINVEYQFDFKKLIFYYFGNFHRVDFRGLIKELFKIYKTRIWLCAVLPCDHPELYTGSDGLQLRTSLRLADDIPPEYVSAELLAGGNFDRLTGASYFHTRNILNLIGYVEQAADGYFYGFNVGTL